jgi:aconitate hydratase
VTTDHISRPARSPRTQPGRAYLIENGGVEAARLQQLRRAPRQRPRDDPRHLRQHPAANQLAPGTEGGVTITCRPGERDVDLRRRHAYQQDGTPLVVLAGKDYGMGSSRDWAAKGTYLLGVKAVIAESFERIHRSNLVGMGVLPLQFVLPQRRHPPDGAAQLHEAVSARSASKAVKNGGANAPPFCVMPRLT